MINAIPPGMDPAQALHELGFSKEDARAFVDWHSHELAEQQRDYAEQEWPGDGMRPVLRRVIAGRLADLIDPEVRT